MFLACFIGMSLQRIYFQTDNLQNLRGYVKFGPNLGVGVS